MLVTTAKNQLTMLTEDNVLHTVPYTELNRHDLILQARYHRWIREQEYRRELVCRLCKEDMDVQSDLDEQEGVWQILMVCSCRAFYGKIALSDLASAMSHFDSSSITSSDS